MVTQMDRAIGRVLGALDDADLADNRLLLFVSDNGGDRAGGGDNTQVRGNKATTFDGGIRVPAIVRWPRELHGGRIHNAPITYLDVLPTIARVAGACVKGGWPLDRS
jgi:arylsulfatase B